MTKIKIITAILMILCTAFQVSSQTAVGLRNEGALYIGNNGSTTINIAGSVRMFTSSKVELNGTMAVGGNFYQDATSNVFIVDGNGKGTSTGILSFVNNLGTQRYITSTDALIFDRSKYYIASPNVLINTNDSIIVPARLGMDAKTLKRSSGKTGKLVLRSDVIDSKVYDASLRITDAGNSADLVDAGAVVVERSVSAYRNGTHLFPFATPFKNTQMAGYFAGNWLRAPEVDGTYGHTTYVLGNKPSASNSSIIDLSQYLRRDDDILIPGRPYLIKPRAADFDYSTLKVSNGLSGTGAEASAYNVGKFVFDGSPYYLAEYNEQLFADQTLYTNTINATTTTTVNWLIGNSYTAPISTSKLITAMKNSGIQFSNTIYVYSAGSTSYQSFVVDFLANPIQLLTLPEIPSMSVFLLRLKKTAQSGTFSITKDMLTHGLASHNSPSAVKAASSESTNKIVFKLTPANNANIYDLAAIGLREDASLTSDQYDISKVINPENAGFQLYSLSGAGTKLASNGVPLTTEKVCLALKSAPTSGKYTLTATDVETLSSDGAWLEDLYTGIITDLKTTPSYTFETDSIDINNQQRFMVHFVYPVITKNDQVSGTGSIYAYYFQKHVEIRHLMESDLGSSIRIYDMQGRAVLEKTVTDFPAMSVDADLAEGIYVVRVSGQRQVTGKFIVKNI